MLVLTRKARQQIRIGDKIVVTILRIKGGSVRVGIDAPKNVRVVRAELPALPQPADVVEVAPGRPVEASQRENRDFTPRLNPVERQPETPSLRPLAGLAERVAMRQRRLLVEPKAPRVENADRSPLGEALCAQS